MFDSGKIQDKQAFFIYCDSKGDIKRHHVVNLSVSGAHFQGVVLPDRRFKTFRQDRVIEMATCLESLNAIELPTSAPDFRPVNTKKTKNDSLEICFTGFSAADKKRLEQTATDANMSVVHGITTNLSFLCCGKNAGPTKITKAKEKGSLILTEDQLLALLETGELPEFGTYDLLNPEPVQVDADDLDYIKDTFSTLRTIPRRQSLIAVFVDRYAAGWKFAVHECHKPALDIKLTPLVCNKKTEMVLTQGHAFNFLGGELIHSHRSGLDGPWVEYLNTPGAVSLSVKYSTPAGFDTVDTLDGEFTGVLRKNNASTSRGAREQHEVPIRFESQSYDEGVLTVNILRPDGNVMKIVDTVQLTQVEFVTLLQFGAVTRVVKVDDTSRIETLNLFEQ